MQDATTIEVFDEAGRLDCGYEFHVVLARTAVDFRGNAELEVIRQVSVRRHKLVAVSFKNVERLQNTVTTALQLKPSGKTKLIAITGTALDLSPRWNKNETPRSQYISPIPRDSSGRVGRLSSIPHRCRPW
jgi:hypothetical protein